MWYYLSMIFSGIHHTALICSDYGRSRAFYVDTLGLTVLAETFRAERNSWKLDLDVNGAGRIELFSFPDAPERLSYPEARGLRHLAFAVSDVEGAAAELRRKGIETEPVRTDGQTGKKFVFFADPDGLPLELYEYP